MIPYHMANASHDKVVILYKQLNSDILTLERELQSSGLTQTTYNAIERHDHSTINKLVFSIHQPLRGTALINQVFSNYRQELCIKYKHLQRNIMLLIKKIYEILKAQGAHNKTRLSLLLSLLFRLTLKLSLAIHSSYIFDYFQELFKMLSLNENILTHIFNLNSIAKNRYVPRLAHIEKAVETQYIDLNHALHELDYYKEMLIRDIDAYFIHLNFRRY